MLGGSRLAIVLVVLWAWPTAAQAPAARDTYGLLPLLIDLPGWTANAAQALGAPGISNVAAAERIYRRGEAMLTVGITSDPSHAEAVQRMTLPPGTDSRTMRIPGLSAHIQAINGFPTSSTVPDGGTEGLIMVVLSEGTMVPAVFVIAFKDTTPDEALEIAKRFDWAAMRTQLRAVR